MSETAKITIQAEDLASAIIEKVTGHVKVAGDTAEQTTAQFSGFGGAAGQATHLLEAFGVSLSIAGLVEFGHELLRTGDELVRVADRTGLTTVEVQQLQYIAGQSGNSLDELTGAISKLQKNLTTGDDSAVAAVKQLHLNLDALKQATPYQQMEQIASAIEKVEDPAQRATLAIQLFGRSGAAILPTLVAHFKELGDAAPTMSDSTARALDAAGDTLHHFSSQVKVWAAELYNMGGHVFDAITEEIMRFVGTLEHSVAALLDLSKNVPGVSTALQKLGVDTSALRESADSWTAAADAQIDRMNLSEVAVRKTAVAMEEFEPKVAKVKDGLTDAEKAALKFAESAFQWTALWSRPVGLLSDVRDLTMEVDTRFEDAREALERLTSTANEAHNGLSIMGDTLATVDIPLFEKLGQNVVPQATKAISEATKETYGFRVAVEHSLGDLPNILQRAFEGGGGIDGALKSIAVDVGTRWGTAVSDSINDALFGKSGTFWESDKGKAYTAAMIAGATALADATSDAITKKGQVGHDAAVGAQYGSIAGPYGMLVGAGIGALVGALKVSPVELAGRDIEGNFEKQFGSFDKMAKAISEAYAATGRSAAQANQDVLAMFAAEQRGADATKAAVDKINKAFIEQKQDAADLDTAIQRYGFSIDELGPAMQKQKLDEQAQQLLNDWRLLVGAGMDIKTVDEHMAKSIEEYLQLAIKTGQEVPREFEPILQKMIDQGILTDANGEKVKNLKDIGVTFSETMTQGFDRVVDKLNTLLEGLGMIPKKIADIPKTIDIDVNVGRTDAIPMAEGGFGTVTRPTLFVAGEKGPEDFAFSGANRKLPGLGGDRAVTALNHGLEAHTAALSAKFDALGRRLERLMESQPIMLRHALRGAH